MARNKVDECMFCGHAPCKCNEKPKAVPRKRSPKPEATETPAPERSPSPALGRPSALAAMQQAARESAARVPTASVQVQPVQYAKQEVDPHLITALVALDTHGMLTPLEKRKHTELLASPEGLTERRKAWKARIVSESG